VLLKNKINGKTYETTLKNLPNSTDLKSPHICLWWLFYGFSSNNWRLKLQNH